MVLKDGYRPEHFVPGPLVQAMRAGGIVYLEEVNRAPSGALNVLITALSERYLEVPRLGRVDARPQLSRRIGTRLAAPLFRLPPGLDAHRNALAVLNLRRGKALQLPSGQAVAARMSVTPLAPAELGLDKLGLVPEHQAAPTADTPLWYYILRETEVRHNGEHGSSVCGAVVVFWRRRPRGFGIVVCALGDAVPELADPLAEVAAQRGQSTGSEQDREHQDDDEILVVHLQRFPGLHETSPAVTVRCRGCTIPPVG